MLTLTPTLTLMSTLTRPSLSSRRDTYLLQLLQASVWASRSRRVSGVALGPGPAPPHLLLHPHRAARRRDENMEDASVMDRPA